MLFKYWSFGNKNPSYLSILYGYNTNRNLRVASDISMPGGFCRASVDRSHSEIAVTVKQSGSNNIAHHSSYIIRMHDIIHTLHIHCKMG